MSHTGDVTKTRAGLPLPPLHARNWATRGTLPSSLEWAGTIRKLTARAGHGISITELGDDRLARKGAGEVVETQRRSSDTSGEGGTPSVPIPIELLCKAYRVDVPCSIPDDPTGHHLALCVHSPRCYLALQTLRDEPSTLADCAAYMMGKAPTVLPLPVLKDKAAAVKAEDRGLCHIDSNHPCLWRGVRNMGNTCYLSSVVQLIFGVGGVRRALLNAYDLNAPLEVSRPSSEVRASGLGELFAQLAFGRDGRGADPHQLTTFLLLDPNVQQDAQEFLVLLLDWLRCRCGPQIQSAVETSFAGTHLFEHCCSSCGRSSKRAEPFLYLSVPVRDSLEDSLTVYTRLEEVEGYTCEGCGATITATSRLYLRSLPDVLVIHMNRFEFNKTAMQRQKVLRSVTYPARLDMGPYLRQWAYVQSAKEDGGAPSDAPEAVDVAEGTRATHLYDLHGVLHHWGETAHSGHYTYSAEVTCAGSVHAAKGDPAPLSPTSVKTSSPSAERSVWLSFDDDEVTRETPAPQGTTLSSRSAYVLVYRRVPSNSPKAISHVGKDAPIESPLASKKTHPIPEEFPSSLLTYVADMNAKAESVERAWRASVAGVKEHLTAWASVARGVLGGSSHRTGSAAETEMYCVPSAWLQRFGRCFIPPFVDVSAFGKGGATGTPADDMSRALASGRDGALPTPFMASLTEATPSVSAAGESVASKVSQGGSAAEGTAVAMVNPLVRAIQADNLEHAFASISCPHGRISPWASYKIVADKHFLALVGFMNSNAGGTGAASVGKCFSLRSNACNDCVADLAAQVVAVAEQVRADAATLRCVQDTPSAGAPSTRAGSSKTNGGGANDREPAAGLMYVHEEVIEAWLAYATSLMSEWDKAQHTGDLARLCALVCTPGGTTCSSGTRCSLAAFISPLVQRGNDGGDLAAIALLCPHGDLDPTAPVRAVRDSVYDHLLQRLPCLLVKEVARTGGAGVLLPVEEAVARLLPRAPVSNTRKCPLCIQQTVGRTRSLHQHRLHRMEEVRRLPTVWLGGKFTDPATVQAMLDAGEAEHVEQIWHTQHPNSIYFRKPVGRLYKEYVSAWNEEHTKRLTRLRTTVSDLLKAVKQQQERDAAWKAVKVTVRPGRGSSARGRGRQSMDQAVPPSPPPAAKVDPRSLVGRLYAAEKAFSEIEAETPPPLIERFGCLPSWWVAQWFTAMSSDGGVAASPSTAPPEEEVPRLDYDRFICPHGGSLLEMPWLNPADSFWHGTRAKQAGLLWSSPSAAPGDGAVTNMHGRSTVNSCGSSWYPPLLIVPWDEYVYVLSRYGDPSIANTAKTLEPATKNDMPVGDNDACPSSKLVLLTERSGERILQPPVCSLCCSSLVHAFEENGSCFTNGHLILKLHLRVSKKQFYDAVSTLRGDATDGASGVHHYTTLDQLHTLIVEDIMRHHGYIVPADQLCIRRGRKPLTRRQPQLAVPTTSSPIADPPSPSEVSNGVSQAASEESLNEATLYELGIHNGDTLHVQVTETKAVPCATTMQTSADRTVSNSANMDGDGWQAIPPELLEGANWNATQENDAAFEETRLLGNHDGDSPQSGSKTSAETLQVSCGVCTYLNAAGMVTCEMCEAPLAAPSAGRR